MVSKEKIYRALKEMHTYKAPRVDGLHALLYQQNWDIVGDSACCFIHNAFFDGCFDTSMKKPLLALRPKVNKPESYAQLRPISLCNVVCKVVANRLKPKWLRTD